MVKSSVTILQHWVRILSEPNVPIVKSAVTILQHWVRILSEPNVHLWSDFSV